MTDAWTYGEAAEPKTFPWPPPEDGSLLAAFGHTWRSATFDPSAFFRRVPRTGGMGAAILYYMALGILLAGVALFWDVTGVFTPPAGDEAVAGETAFGALNPIVSFLLSPLFLILGLFLAAGLTHVALRVVGGARYGFGTTVRVFCFSYSPMAFGIVPYLGHLVGWIWMLVLAIIGLREAHETDGWKAAVAVLLPFFLFVGVLVFLALMLAAAGAALLAL